MTHTSRIKELRAEIQQEKSRRSATEASLQARINRQNDEIEILKGKVEHSKEELAQMKAKESVTALQQLEQENETLKSQISSL